MFDMTREIHTKQFTHTQVFLQRGKTFFLIQPYVIISAGATLPMDQPSFWGVGDTIY